MPPGAKGRRYPEELRERAVRMVFDHQHEYPSQWKAVESVAEKLDVHRETLRVWVRKAEVEHGQRAGMNNTERERLKELEAEVKELRRANEILKAAAGFFARELDPRPPKS
jgi:transposase